MAGIFDYVVHFAFLHRSDLLAEVLSRNQP